MVTHARVNPLDALGVENERGGNSLTALKRGKLDFDVVKVPLCEVTAGDTRLQFPTNKYFATVRQDTGAVLGIVEGRYEVIPNRDCFAIADVMTQDDGAIITRASALDQGARCFLSLEWPRRKAISVVGDIVGRRAIMQNAHDGKFAAYIRLMPLRLACLNGLMVPVPFFSFEFRIRHTESSAERIAEAQRVMASAGRYFETFGRVAEQMARTKVADTLAKELTEQLLPQDSTASENKRGEILALFGGEQRNGNHEAIKNTAWGWLNAVAEFSDHAGRIRKTKGNDEAAQRFKSALEGSGQRLKMSAYELLMTSPKLGLAEFHKHLKSELSQN